MKCPACQSDNRESVRFCEECGAKFEIECPICKAPIPLGKKFCGACGNKIVTREKPPGIKYDRPLTYTPKFLADKIFTNRGPLEGERKLVTVLFADVANYTAMAEKLDPEDVHQIMDNCFQILMNAIHRYEGTVNQFTGDGVMAIFGAPAAHEDHAQRACHAAIAIQNALKPFADSLKKQNGIDFRMRIGLNSGPVVVGSIGDDLRMDYTALGDTTNLAARMESAAPSGAIMAAPRTYALARRYFSFEPLGRLQIKGKRELQSAYRLIRSTEVDSRFEAAAVGGLTRFVGRSGEMDMLADAYQKARDGSGQVLGIVGEAGVGKSRLLYEFRNTTLAEKCTYLEGGCLHYGESMPYLPVLDLLRSYFNINEGDQEHDIKNKVAEKLASLPEKLTSYMPSFQDILSLSVDDEKYPQIDPGEKKARIFEGLRDLFISESEIHPLIIAVEDLHWIDKTSEAFISYLIDWLPSSRVLLILLYRSEYTHPWGSKSYYSKLGVGQLSGKTSIELARAVLMEGNVAPEIRELVLGRSGGNPLFIEELTQSLLENGSIAEKENMYVLTRDVSEILVPETIEAIIAARIDRIEENMKRVLKMAAVIGRQFAFRILQNVMEMKADLKLTLLNLQGLEFIHEKRLFPELEYIFKHALTQEVVYNSLLQKRRKEIHEKIGKAIEALYPDRLEEFYALLSYHYEQSNNKEKTIEYLDKANQKAARFNSMQEAKAYFDKAMAVMDDMPDNKENRKRKINLILNQWVVYWMLYRTPEYHRLLASYERITVDLKTDDLLGTFYAFLGQCKWVFGHFDDAITIFNKAVNLLKTSNRFEIAGLAYVYIQWCHFYRGEAEKSFYWKDKALQCMQKHFDLRLYVWSLAAASWGYSIMGCWEKAVKEGEKALLISEEYSNNSMISFAAWVTAQAYTFQGDLDKANELAELGVQKAPTPADKVWAQGTLGWSLCRAGKLKKGVGILSKILPLYRKAQFLPGEIITLVSLGEGYLLSGQYDQAGKALKNSLKLAEKPKMRFYIACAYRLLGEIALKTNLAQSAIQFEKSIEIAKEIKAENELALAYAGLGRYYKLQKNMAAARNYLNQALEIFERLGTLLEPDKVREELAKLSEE